ncbi:MAG: PEP-utilizing enzyme [Candidatus Micrarchaeota archaeon]
MEKVLKTFTRDFCLATSQWWRETQFNDFKRELGVSYRDTIAVGNGLCVEFFFLESDMTAIKQAVVSAFKRNPRYYLEKRETFIKNISATRLFIEKFVKGELTTANLQKLRFYFKGLYPFYRFTLLLPTLWEADVRIAAGKDADASIKAAFKDRLFAEGTFEAVDAALRTVVKKHLKKIGKSEKLERFVTSDEINSLAAGKEINWSEVNCRTGGFVYCNDKVYSTRDYKKVFKENNYFYEEDVVVSKDVVKGVVACNAGIVRGKVRVIFAVEQLRDFRAGEIMVTPMTTPDFVQVMKRAAAIVTNEGGMTCHAAIVARELKLPCVIGTKVATKVFKTGDEVEVNSETGMVKKI